MFDSSWSLVDRFTDPGLPDGYAPFGIQAIGGNIFVTFAKQDADARRRGRRPGPSDSWTSSTRPGTSSRASPSTVSSTRRGGSRSPRPTSAASAATCSSATSATVRSTPTSRGANGRWSHRGELRAGGRKITIDGLWALEFGNGGNAGARNSSSSPRDPTKSRTASSERSWRADATRPSRETGSAARLSRSMRGLASGRCTA